MASCKTELSQRGQQAVGTNAMQQRIVRQLQVTSTHLCAACVVCLLCAAQLPLVQSQSRPSMLCNLHNNMVRASTYPTLS
jgi:hypothetical protein